MFSRQKAGTDVKKSTTKFLDSKKDVPTRLKHLKLILDSVDIIEAKALFAQNYSHIYHLVYEGIICAESSLKTKGVHRAQREELEAVLYMLEKVLVLLPDLLHCRWQLHSIARLMAKLNHPGNALVLRKTAIRLFIMWYQCLGTSAPAYVHSMFASLVPGLPPGCPDPWPSNQNGSDPCPVSPYEITPVLPSSSGEKIPEDGTQFFLEHLLDFLVSQAPKIQWNDGSIMWPRSIDFLYERFKELYLPRIFLDFNVGTNIYKPNLELPEPRKTADLSNNVHTACQIVFVRWIANYAHSVYPSINYSMPGGQPSSLMFQSQFSSHEDGRGMTSTPPSSLGDRDSITSFSSISNNDVDANVIAKDVILGSRDNINFLHEVFRRALLMNFVQTIAMRRVICVYKDWIQMNVPELPVFMLEPEEGEAVPMPSLDLPKNPRLRTDSYYGAVGLNANNNREEYLSHLRAGAQNILQIFFCNSAAVFLLFQIPKHEAAMAFLEEQVDICKRVLNIYRYAVMNTRMSSETWEQLLVVLLHITSRVLDIKESHFSVKNPDSLGSRLASALFQTLIVSWVKASLNVQLPTELWDRLQEVLSQLSFCDDLVTEWSKTMETLTRVLSRHVYNLDLANLPLEQKRGKGRRTNQGQTSLTTGAKEPLKRSPASDIPDGSSRRQDRKGSSGASERKSFVIAPTTPNFKRKLKRSLSDGNLSSPPKKNPENETSTDGDSHPHSLTISPGTQGRMSAGNEILENVLPELGLLRRRKISRSMDSLRTLKIATHFGHIGNPGALNPDWAEISSSTASLENTSHIQIEDSTSLDGGSGSKTEVRGVISGGTVKGWLPSVAAILWRRMLGILGNVNEFSNPKTHAHFFKVLSEMWETLYKLRQNQDISLDNASTPKPSELCPPLTLLSGWCFEAFDLSEDYYKGTVLACALLCEITLANQDIPFSQEYLTKFYAVMHKTIIANSPEMINEIVRKCGYKFVSKMLPGFSLLLLDLSQASHAVLISDNLKTAPRMEAASIIGSVLTVADVCKELPILKPNTLQFQPITSHPTNDVVLSCLLQFAKAEQTSHARSICLQSLTIYVCKELMKIRHSGFRPSPTETERVGKINTVFSVLLASVKVANRSVALVAADLLLVLSDFAPEVSSYFPNIVQRIIQGLRMSLMQALPLKNSGWTKEGKPVEAEKRLLISLLMTIGEWCMKLPVQSLLFVPENGRIPLLASVFEVIHATVSGYQIPSATNEGTLQSLEDFDPSIPFDDLQLLDHSYSGSMEKNSSFSKGEKENPPSQDLETVKLAARSVLSHLLTQLGHFPMAGDSSKCGSVLSENDDLPLTLHNNSDVDELNIGLFSLPNVQLFALDHYTLLSIVELPPQEDNPGGGFIPTASSQVRIILRDLGGKASWDATNLFSPDLLEENEESEEASALARNTNQEEMFHVSTLTGNFLPQVGPRLTTRKRGHSILPNFANSADDLDNVDDLLSYIGHTSPECLQRIGEPLNTPWKPPSTISQENEDEAVLCVVNHRNNELEFLMKFEMDSTMRAIPASSSHCKDVDFREFDGGGGDLPSIRSNNTNAGGPFGSQFISSRRLFSQLGLLGWDKRKSIHVLKKDEKLLRELKNLDSQKCRETHKIAVIYVAEGQEDKLSILSNSGGSELYEDFVAGLGWEVDLETHPGFMGGLQRNKSTGETAPYYATSFTEVIFHVATRMPSNTEEGLLQKTRHLGNDEVHIVWSEHCRDYRRDIIPTEFCDVLIVIYPLRFGLFRVQVTRKAEVPYFGPLYNEAIVERDVLPMLVRATAINASRAKRSSLQFWQHHFEERFKCLSTVINNYKSRTTFETFASNVFCPVLPPPPPVFQNRDENNRASVASFSSSRVSSALTERTAIVTNSSTSSQLSTALLDSTISSSRKGKSYDIPFTPPELRSGRSSGIGGAGESSPTPEPPPVVPPKKTSVTAKLAAGLKPKLHTPPASPLPPQKKY